MKFSDFLENNNINESEIIPLSDVIQIIGGFFGSVAVISGLLAHTASAAMKADNGHGSFAKNFLGKLHPSTVIKNFKRSSALKKIAKNPEIIELCRKYEAALPHKKKKIGDEIMNKTKQEFSKLSRRESLDVVRELGRKDPLPKEAEVTNTHYMDLYKKARAKMREAKAAKDIDQARYYLDWANYWISKYKLPGEPNPHYPKPKSNPPKFREEF